MVVKTITDGHVDTTRMETYEIARELTDALGPTLVAVLAGVRDRKLPSKWAKEGGPVPRPESLRKLQTAHRVWRFIKSHDNEWVAKAWFIGLNPLLDEKPPVVALNEGRDREVVEAARAFVEDDRTE